MSRKSHLTLVLGMALLVLGASKAAASQNQPSNGQSVQRPTDIRDIPVPDSKRQLKRLSRKLKLTSDQITRVRAILSDRDRQIELIQASESLQSKAKGARIRTIVVGSNELVESVLNGRQKQKFEEVLARQLRRQERNREA